VVIPNNRFGDDERALGDLVFADDCYPITPPLFFTAPQYSSKED